MELLWPHKVVEVLGRIGVRIYRSLLPSSSIPHFVPMAFFGPVWYPRGVRPVDWVRFVRAAGLDGLTFEVQWDDDMDKGQWESVTWPWLRELVRLADLYGLALFIVFLNDNVWQKPLLRNRLCYRLRADDLITILARLKSEVPASTWIEFVSEWSGKFSVPTAVRNWGYSNWPGYTVDCKPHHKRLIYDAHIKRTSEIDSLSGAVVATGDTPEFLSSLYRHGVLDTEYAADQLRRCRRQGIGCSIYAARTQTLNFDILQTARLWRAAWREGRV